MNNSMNNSTASMSSMMMPWLHFGNTDYLIFETWQPASQGAIAGACIGLFLFCILERCLAAYRRAEELRWRAKTSILMTKKELSNASEKQDTGDAFIPRHRQLIPPFVPSQDIPRGIIQGIQSTFSFALMLAVMTFNTAYIISIILGLGVGEVLFGRIGRDRKQEV